MRLLIDIGNSRIKWVAQADRGSESYDACCYEHGRLQQALLPAMRDLQLPEQVYVANVAGAGIAGELDDYLANRWSIKPAYLQVSAAAAGVVNAYEDFGQLGIDRWLAMIAAWNRLGRALCVVDCGTACTMDLVADTGRHLGGYILPGLQLMSEALNRRTQQIKTPPSPIASLQPGRNTAACISNGALASNVALVRNVYDELRQQYGDDSCCIITGGRGEEVYRALAINSAYDPHLVLKGMSVLLERSS